MGCVILKDNVLEGSKLACELDHITQLQKKQVSKMNWEQEYISRKQRRTLGARVFSEPNLLRKTTGHLPPISHDSTLVCPSGDADRIDLDDKQTKEPNEDTKDAAPKRSRKLSEQGGVKHFIHSPVSRVKFTDSTSSLPALVSPRLLRRRIQEPVLTHSLSYSRGDSVKDPRFSKLMESLVPASDSKANECDSNSRTTSPVESSRSDTPCPSLHAQI